MKLRGRDATALLEIIADIHSAETRDDLWSTCRHGLHRLIPADLHDIIVLGSDLPEGGLYLGTPGGFSEEEKLSALRNGYEHPVVERFLARGDLGPTRTSEVVPTRQWKNSAYYALGNGRLRQDYELIAILPGVSANGMAGIAISRSRHDFNATDAAVLGHCRGHIGLALGRILRQERQVAAPFPKGFDERLRFLNELGWFTGRESEVAFWIAEGKQNREIASILGISLFTVQKHVANMLHKRHLENRHSLAVEVLRQICGG